MYTDRPGMYPLTEDQIERAVERRVTRLDAIFMNGGITEEEYGAAMKEIRLWADVEYRYRDSTR